MPLPQEWSPVGAHTDLAVGVTNFRSPVPAGPGPGGTLPPDNCVQHFILQADGGRIRWTMDGSVPSATHGVILLDTEQQVFENLNWVDVLKVQVWVEVGGEVHWFK